MTVPPPPPDATAMPYVTKATDGSLTLHWPVTDKQFTPIHRTVLEHIVDELNVLNDYRRMWEKKP